MAPLFYKIARVHLRVYHLGFSLQPIVLRDALLSHFSANLHSIECGSCRLVHRRIQRFGLR